MTPPLPTDTALPTATVPATDTALPTATIAPTASPVPSPGEVDHLDPVSVVQAVFDAARSQDFSALAGLCDPLGEHDGDSQLVCGMTEDNPDRDTFVAIFEKGQVAGEAVIEGDQARVPILFGLEGDREETLILIQREGKWYLYSF